MTNAEFISFLSRRNACDPALTWIGARTPEQAWAECEDGSWMEWLLDEIAIEIPAECRRVAAQAWDEFERVRARAWAEMRSRR